MSVNPQSTSGIVFPSQTDEEMTLAYPDPEPYNPRHEIRFFRLHLTEAAARARVTADVDAFSLAFPDVVALQKGEVIIRERYVCYGAIGCIIWIRILVDEQVFRSINRWFSMLETAWQVEGRGQH